jgi:TonB family protein
MTKTGTFGICLMLLVLTHIVSLGRDENLKPTITRKVKAKYTKEAKKNGVEGVVVLKAVFRADGRITDIEVIKSLPYGLTEKAIEAAQKIKFKPVIKDGRPVSVRGNLEYVFELRK